MKRFISLIAISSCFLCSGLYAQETLKILGEWMGHYYEKPNPDQLTRWISDASVAGAFDKTSARFTLMIFISEVLKQHPEKSIQWCKELSSLSPAHKGFVGWSFHNANIPGQDECIREQLGLNDVDQKKIIGASRYDPLSREPSNPGDLDMLWAVFSATGNEVAVNKIISVLGRPSPEKGQPGSVEMLLLKGAAKWSLSSNIYQHKRVAEIAKARRSIESGDLKKELDEIILNASRQSRGQNPSINTDAAR